MIEKNNFIVVREPSAMEKEQQVERIRIGISGYGRSREDIIDQVCMDYPDLGQKNKDTLYNTIPNIVDDGSEEDVVTKTRGMIRGMLGEV